MTPRTMLTAIKVAHRAIWAFFVLMICAIWVFAVQANFVGAALATAIVLVEVAILGFNHGQCLLGRIVKSCTENRAANFDIYLPAWLAEGTKRIFGSLFSAGVVLAALRWAMAA